MSKILDILKTFGFGLIVAAIVSGILLMAKFMVWLFLGIIGIIIIYGIGVLLRIILESER